MSGLTKSQREALEILGEYGPMLPSEFAELMWPDSDGWDRPHPCGPNGASNGAAMPLAAGGYLGKLCKKGLAKRRLKKRSGVKERMYDISGRGRNLLVQESERDES